MDCLKAIEVLEYTKHYDDCSGASRIAIDRAIDALHFETRARELLQAAVELLNKQIQADVVLNMLEETVYYDEAECDGRCLFEDMCSLLVEGY